ncbi:MAG TPA: serine hydrolase domain-containing protein [Acidobacteriota bacterium]|nr:serine hydrolase domain-containing protein [Acidobacteriota bacterium]
MRWKLILTVLAFLWTLPAWAGPSDIPASEIDAVFAAYDKPDSPGCALGLIRDGELVYSRGYGQANLEYGIPLSSKSVFRIGSTSKQFTAAAIFLLEQDGRLSLDDDIRKHVPELPAYQAPVTIRHLVHHTSGIRDYLTLMSLAGLRDADFYTDEEVIAMLARQKELNFAPGEEHLYSNSGYFLLAEIVKRASGKSLREFAAERIFTPLGMKNSHFHNDYQMIVPNRASGYARRPEGAFRISMTTLEMIGDGGVFTSIEDLLLWDRNFYSRKVGGDALFERQHETGRLNDGESLTYAGGLTVAKYRGLPTVRHGGAFVGFRAELLRFPEQRLSIACLCNLAQTRPSDLANQVADIVLQDEFTEPKSGPGPRSERDAEAQQEPSWRPDRDALAAFAGRYHSPELDSTLEVFLEGETLRVRNVDAFREAPEDPLQPDSPNQFRLGRIRLRFEVGDNRAARHFRMDAGRVKNILFERLP